MTEAYVAARINERENTWLLNLLAVGGGVLLVSLLAQVAIPLPWTPVPITGQTFGVTLVALLWGRKLGVATLVTYLALGSVGLPIFTAGSSGLVGPTAGYLVGMVAAAYTVGTFADQGWTKTFLGAFLSAVTGSVLVFSCGLFVLSFYLPTEGLLAAGFLPFLFGDFVKNSTAAFLASRAQKN